MMGTFNANAIPEHDKENLTAEEIKSIKKELPYPNGKKDAENTAKKGIRDVYAKFDRTKPTKN